MSAPTTTIKLTRTEADYILHLVKDNERNGEYYGPLMTYWRRVGIVKTKLEKAIKAFAK